MPGGKLKSALASHQQAQQHHAARKRADAHSKLKAQSIKSSLSGSKKGKKKAQAPLPSASDRLAVTSDTAMDVPSTATPTSTPGPAPGRFPVIPFDAADTILLLGEANFSFALSLITHHAHPPRQLLATAFDPEPTILAKYPDAGANLARLRAAGVRVAFGVDAGALEKSKAVGKGRRWSRVIFNFPHAGECSVSRLSPVLRGRPSLLPWGKTRITADKDAGAGITDQDRNILTNQHLLLRTLRSVPSILTAGPSSSSIHPPARGRSPSFSRSPSPGFDPLSASPDDPASAPGNDPLPPARPGTLLITLLTSPPYSLWALPSLAKRPPPLCPGTRLPQPRWRVCRSFEFHPGAYPGYEHRRTIGWKEGVSKGGNEEILPVRGEGDKGTGTGKGGKGQGDRARVARTWELEPLPMDSRAGGGDDSDE